MDKAGNPIAGMQLALDGGGNPVFTPTSGANGEFGYDMMNYYSSSRWHVRLIGYEEAVATLDIEPYKRYTVIFQEMAP